MNTEEEYEELEENTDTSRKRILKFVFECHDFPVEMKIVIKYDKMNSFVTVGGFSHYIMVMQYVMEFFKKVPIIPASARETERTPRGVTFVKTLEDISDARKAYAEPSLRTKHIPDVHSQINKLAYAFPIKHKDWPDILKEIESDKNSLLIPVSSHGRLL